MARKSVEIKFILLMSLFAIFIFYSALQISAECAESWTCTEWTECDLAGAKSRSCTEMNHCNTTVEKPSENRTCGENCILTRACRDWNPCKNGKQTRICYDTNTCGGAEKSAIEWQPCSTGNETNATTNATMNANASAVNLEQNASQEEEEDEKEHPECEGCFLDGTCFDYGERLEYDGKPRYCDSIDSKVKTQKMRNAQGKLVSCAENYECQSNVCAEKKCFDLQEAFGTLKRGTIIYMKIICRLSTLFQSSGYEQCIYGRLVEEL